MRMRTGPVVVVHEPLDEALAAAGRRKREAWLYCLYCDHFFQAKHLRLDDLGNREGCAFCDCAGFDVAIHPWDRFGFDDPTWPRTEADLFHGRHATGVRLVARPRGHGSGGAVRVGRRR